MNVKKILELLSDKFVEAFEGCGYDSKYAKVSISNRPDLCEYQCNGAMAAAKEYKKASFVIANEVVDKLKSDAMFEMIECVNPGFINMRISAQAIKEYIAELAVNYDKPLYDAKDTTIFIDYGGPNVAKPLHIGHLRSAVIGESIKRISRFAGYNVVSDVHLGDWGLQMGLIIVQLKEEQPDLPYFDDSFEGEYPLEAPFSVSELESIYPTASAKSKVDEDFKKKAQEATGLLQKGHRGYTALWKHIMNVSLEDLKKNYEKLLVDFDLWKGESDAEPYIADMIKDFEEKGLAYESQGATVIDVALDSDTKEIPPCIVKKSDGASLYATSDLASIIERNKFYNPKKYIYVVDKRQEMHFTQVFRVAKKANLVPDDVEFNFLGFGTMNGKDGKPFKTREGGVMRLENLIADINDAVYNKIIENRETSEEEAKATAKIVGLAALKYGDLSNQATKDYVFDIDRFISFEGDTGPYILYTIVRIKSIIEKYMQSGKSVDVSKLDCPNNASLKALMLELANFREVVDGTFIELAPHKLCKYIYELSNVFNRFYHETKILTEEDENKQAAYVAAIALTKDILLCCIELLGFEAPDRM